MLYKLANNFFGKPSAKIKLVGVTGTNGKTTIATLLGLMPQSTSKTLAATASSINLQASLPRSLREHRHLLLLINTIIDLLKFTKLIVFIELKLMIIT